MPKEIVQAWEKAGAEVGWMRHHPEGGLIFATETKSDAGVAELPAFSFRWQAGVLPKLPPPAAPFGLFLGRNPNMTTDEWTVTDAGLKELADLKSLQSLALGGSRVTDAGLKELAGLKGLRTLYLDRTRITDAGLKDLARLESLRSLCLSDTQVTDAGLKDLAGLKGLRELYLDHTQVTDAGLKDLAGLRSLQTLRAGGKVTDAGLKELRKALPHCEIRR